MIVCRKCKKLIMYAVNGYCEECVPAQPDDNNAKVEIEFDKQKAEEE